MNALTLDEAWAVAEAALPDGAEIYDLTRYRYDSDCGMESRNEEWTASAGVWRPSERFGESHYEGHVAIGATPVAALLALAERLGAPEPVR